MQSILRAVLALAVDKDGRAGGDGGQYRSHKVPANGDVLGGAVDAGGILLGSLPR